MHGEHQHELLPKWLQVTSAILLTLLILTGYVRTYFKTKIPANAETLQHMKQLKIKVEGMTCNHCKMNVEKTIGKLEGIDYVLANPDTAEVIIRGSDPDLEKIRIAVEDIGYEYSGASG
jgi:copper chaperone CopZ